MLSVPAAIMMSASPVRMRSAAIETAFRPDEQKRLTVMPATVFGNPGEQESDTRDVHALLVFGHRAADDHVLDPRRIELRHLRQHAAQHVREQRIRPRVPERAARRLADRRARRGNDVRILQLLAHRVSSALNF